MKKFIVAKFLDYEMIASKTVVTQVQERQVIIHDILAEGLIVNDAFQVAAIIKKLPPLWKDFKKYLENKHKERILEDLIIRLRIEENNKATEKRSRGNSAVSGVNVVEEDPTKIKKKENIWATECWGTKKDKKKKHQANLAESKGEMEDLCAMLSEYEKLFMANSVVAKVEGAGKVLLKMTSDKVVTLNRVSYVSEMRKNLVSIPVLTKNGFKCVFVSDKVVISKNDMYVGKGYLNDGLFKFNVILVDKNKDFASSYLLESKCL
ncbi:uncharacterized protein [Solanum lycopersicum]|uniref:uncharacterized protein n=1 Tax=Solanum lycopersicum TaxID=4081 RepID=UPI00374A94CE